MSFLGRGRSRINFDKTLVHKTSDLSEAELMLAFPTVFVPILAVDTHSHYQCTFTMPRYNEPDVVEDIHGALLQGSFRLQTLWEVPEPEPRDGWRDRLREHLAYVKDKYALRVSDELMRKAVERLPDVEQHVQIHGDPTLANIVWREFFPNAREWLWIDPLSRDYIPGDPHVDLGKICQSCLGYERVLLGGSLTTELQSFFVDLSRSLGLDHQLGYLWCIIHMIRLLPYQRNQERVVFEKFLEEVRL